MDESADNQDDLNFWLIVCAVLTVLCYGMFGLLFFLFRRIVNDALAGLRSGKSRKPRTENVLPLSNFAAVTKVDHNENSGSLSVGFSLRDSATLFILRSVPLSTLHHAMVDTTDVLVDFLRKNASQTTMLTPDDSLLNVKTNEERVDLHKFRQTYDLVLAFYRASERKDEECTVVSIHIIHVKQHKEEHRATQILYSYCKTNFDRLVCAQQLFTAANRTASEEGRPPDCVICLTEGQANTVFVPCRHVAICKTCLPAFQTSSQCLHCPVCRAAIVEIKLL
uniref:RING-type domain-containing protein n=1 Tax=Mesocestoides corti TaxID=53468 RepID=A0A5K3F8Z1_MESCO